MLNVLELVFRVSTPVIGGIPGVTSSYLAQYPFDFYFPLGARFLIEVFGLVWRDLLSMNEYFVTTDKFLAHTISLGNSLIFIGRQVFCLSFCSCLLIGLNFNEYICYFRG